MTSHLSAETAVVLEALADAAVVVDPDGVIVFANQSAGRLFGCPASRLLGESVDVLVPAESRERHAHLRAGYGASGDGRRMGSGLSLSAVCADGTRIAVDVSLDPIGPPDQGLTLACIRDMRAHAELLETARRAEERYRMVVTSASEVFYRVMMDADPMRAVVSFVSPQCEKLTGHPPEAFLTNGALWLECVHPDDRDILFRTTSEILRNGVEASRYYRLLNRETGEYRAVADRVVPLHDPSGRVIGYQGVARDVTERRKIEAERARLEEELRLAQKMDAIGRLAGGVAHDFNNLISVVLASCDGARDVVGPDSSAQAFLIEIQDAAHRAAGLTRQLLTLSHEQPAASHVIDLNTHLRASGALLRRLLPERIELVWRLDDGLWPVRIDEGQLDQVVFNLVANARDAVTDAGTVTISTDNVTHAAEHVVAAGGPPAGEYVRLEVADTGTGMDAGVLAHIFEPFYTTKPSGKGTGLGLASVYGIVRQNLGDVHVESMPGAGTRVTILLPRGDTM